MGKAIKEPQSLSLSAQQMLRELIQSANAPLTAAQLVKLLKPAEKTSERMLSPVLEEWIEAGQLFRYPPKTAKGKDQFWPLAPEEWVQSRLTKFLQQILAPFTLKDLLKELAKTVKLPDDAVIPILQSSVAEGLLYELPPTTAKSPIRYWTHDWTEYGTRELTAWIREKGPQTRAGLRRPLKGYQPSQVETVLTHCLQTRQLYRHPPLGPVKKELFGIVPPSPVSYLQDIHLLLAKRIPQLLSMEIPEVAIRRALMEAIGGAGITLSQQRAVAEATSSADEETGVSHDVHAQLLQLVRRMEPGADRGSLIGARDLRRLARLGKQQFDAAVLELARQQIFSLHRHDYPASLTAEARDELVTDGAGTYFVGIALRTSGSSPRTSAPVIDRPGN